METYLLGQFPETVKMYNALYAKWRSSAPGTYRKTLHDAMDAIESDIYGQARFQGQNTTAVINTLRDLAYEQTA